MRINHRMIADSINTNLQNSLRRLEGYGNQLSTGKKFTKPSQDPVGVGRVMSYSSSIDRNEQFRLNMNQSKGWLENTENGLQDGLDVMQRIRELCIYGANESLTAEDRRAIAPEVLEFIDHLIGAGNKESNSLHLFGGHQTLEKPFIRENIYQVNVHEDSGIIVDEDHRVEAERMQNGTYEMTQTSAAGSGEDAEAAVTQQFLQGNAESIFGTSELEDIESEHSASMLFEVTGVDEETGEVEYRYSSHEYSLDGEYDKHDGHFTITYGGENSEEVTIGDIEFTLEGLEELDVSTEGIKTGDKAVFNITPSREDGDNYDHVKIAGQFRDDQSELRYIFDEGELDDTNLDLRFHSLNTFDRSPDKGKVYDGLLRLSYEDFEDLGEDNPALTFSYDGKGFPVYYGDDKERIQEISPHQQMVMNLSGMKAFGENQEVFQAVFDVFNALVDNDREALGGSVLEKMDQSIDYLLEQLAEVGARSNRLEAMETTLSSENLFLQEVRSNIEDIDLAYVITEFTMQENAYRAALATAQKMLQPTLVDYMR